MPTHILYDPTESSHVDATTLVTHDAAIYEGDYDNDGTEGDDPLGAVSNIFATGGAAGTSLGIGHAPLGSSTSNDKQINTLFRITLPDGPKTSPTGELIADKNTKIKKVVLKFRSYDMASTGTTVTNAAFAPIIRPVSALDYSAMTWKTFDGTTSWSANGAQSTGDRDTDTDYGSGVDGVIVRKHLQVSGWNEVTLQDNSTAGPSQPKQLGIDWGTTVDIIMFPYSPSAYLSANNYSRIYGLEVSTANLKPYVEVHYGDDKPTKPEISVEPLEDFRHAKISFTKRTEDEDLTQYVMSWRQGGVPTYQTGASAPSYGKVITDTGKEFYHGYNDLYNNGVGNTTFFPGGSSDAGEENQLTIWAEDNNNTGSDGATKGNTISLTRYTPYTIETFTDGDFAKSCSCSWISIGQHTGSNNASVLTDSTSGTTTPWLRGNFVANGVEAGDKVYNITDRSGSTAGVATITAVTDTTVTGSLGSGTDNDWDTNDVYVIVRKVDVGEKVSITIRSTRVAGLLFDKVGINWTNTDTGHISDDAVSTMDNFDIIELDSSTSEHTISYRYTEPGTYYPNFFFVDTATGFRTILRQAGYHNSATETGYALNDATRAAVVVEQPKPVPRLTSSKSIGESANVALDRSSAVIYSGANSTASGSNAYVKNYKWLGEYVSGQILTQGCLDIDNTPLVNESKKLYMRCNTASYNASVFTIYGLASFQADNATSVKDTDTTFSHYRYIKATVSPGSAKYETYNTANTHSTGGAAPVAAVLSGTAEQMYFKQVDFIYCTTKSGTSGTEECYQLLAADSDNDGSIDASGTLDTSTVCKRLVIDSNNGSPGYKWGGLCSVTGSSNITFTKNSGADEIESTAIDFIAAGFGPGDTITVENTSNDGVYTIQKIEKVSSTYSMYLNEELNLTEASTSATIYTTQPTISVASSAAGTAKISLDVTDNLAATGEAPVNIYTTFRDQTYLDLNASADSGYFAIQNASLTRSGGISAAMPLGERRYPPGAVHTKHGLPKMAMTIRVIDSTGFNRMYRLLNNSYNYAVYQHHDTSFASWVKYRLKLESFTVNRDPQNLEHQVVTLSFFIVGEEV
tara:strand:+ start:656 stop:3907 length:3252 start_codon:yes stop_codon:yes gene_type:complete